MPTPTRADIVAIIDAEMSTIIGAPYEANRAAIRDGLVTAVAEGIINWPGTGGGLVISSSNPQPLGTAAPGSTGDVSDAGHVHAMPSAADVGADPAGTASSAVSAHVGAGDPHTQYALESALATVATTGAYGDLTGAPTLGTFAAENTATWAGSSAIVTLGTVTTGTWHGSAIAADYGGTGQTVYVVGDLLYASTTTALSRLPMATHADGEVLTLAGGLPTWAAAAGGAPSGPAGGDLTGTYPNPTIAAGKVTLAKMADIATACFLGRTTAGTGVPEVLTATQATAILDTGTASLRGILLLGANGGAMKYRDTAYAYVSRDSNGDASDLVASSATAPYAFQPVFAQLDSSGHPALLESWAPDPFFGGAYACLNAAAAATPSTSGVFVSAVTSGTVSNVTATYTDGHGWFRFATGTGPTSTAGVDAGGIYVCQTSQHWKVRSTFRVSSIAAAYTIWFVVANAGPSAPPTHYVGLRWIQGTDTNLQIVSKDGTTASSTDSTVAFAANTTYEVVMSWDGTTFTVSINGTVVTKATNMPATTENLGVYLRMFKASGATNYSLDIRDGVQIARLQ